MSSKEKPYLGDKIFGLNYFSGMMMTGDKLVILQLLKSRRIPWNSTCQVMPACSAGQREVSVDGLADKSAGLTQSHKSLSSLPWSTVGISLWCLTLFGGVPASWCLTKAIVFCVLFLKEPGLSPAGPFRLQTPLITSGWLDAKISEEKEMELSISSLLSTVESTGPSFGSLRVLG